MSFYLFLPLLLNLIKSKFQKMTGSYYENVDFEHSKVVLDFPLFLGKINVRARKKINDIDKRVTISLIQLREKVRKLTLIIKQICVDRWIAR